MELLSRYYHCWRLQVKRTNTVAKAMASRAQFSKIWSGHPAQPHSLANRFTNWCSPDTLKESKPSNARASKCYTWHDNEFWCWARRVCADSPQWAWALAHYLLLLSTLQSTNSCSACNKAACSRVKVHGCTNAGRWVWLRVVHNCFRHSYRVRETARTLLFWSAKNEGALQKIPGTRSHHHVPLKRMRRRAKIKTTELISVYCTCKMPELADTKWIECSGCKQWFHADTCIQVKPKYFNPECNCMVLPTLFTVQLCYI